MAGSMICYVVCAESVGDSYHKLITVTLDKVAAEELISDFNEKHDKYDVQYHMHSAIIKGVMPRIRQFVRTANELGVLSELVDPKLALDKPADVC